MQELFNEGTIKDFIDSYINGKINKKEQINTQNLKAILKACSVSDYDHDLISGFLVVTELNSRNFYSSSTITKLAKFYLNAFLAEAIKPSNTARYVKVLKQYLSVCNNYQQRFAKKQNKTQSDLNYLNKVSILKKYISIGLKNLEKNSNDIDSK